jgi:hypothetical protein
LQSAISKAQKGKIYATGGSMAGSPDLSNVASGKTSEAASRLLKEFPQIKSRKNSQQIYTSGLGFWMKKNFPVPGEPGRKGRGDYGDPAGGDMEHPDHGGVVASHRGQGHKKGQALDLGGFGDPDGKDQDKMWPYVRKFLKIYGLDNNDVVPAVYSARQEHYTPSAPGSGPLAGHDNHLHVEFAKGGETLGNPHLAWLGEKGREIVVDADSYPHARDMLLAINQAKDHRGVIKAIQQYAPYDAMSPQTIVMPSSGGESDYDSEMAGGGVMMMDGGGEDSYDPFDALEMGG